MSSRANKIYNFNFRIFNACGFGRIETESKWKLKLYSFYNFFIHITYIITIMIYVTDAYMIRNNLEKLNVNLCITIVFIASTIKLWALDHKMDTLLKIKRKFENHFYLPWLGKDEEDEKIIEENSLKFLKITKLIFGLSAPIGIMWVSIPLLIHGSKERRYPLPFPFFEKVTPIFEIVYLAQVVHFVNFLPNIIAMDLNFLGFLSRVCEQYEILAKNIDRIKYLYPETNFERFVPGYKGYPKDKANNCDENSLVRYGHANEHDQEWRTRTTIEMLRPNIVHHQTLLKQIDDIGNVYSIPLFVQITVGGLLLAVVAFDVIIESRTLNAAVVKQLIYVSIILTDIFMMCYYGTQIAEKSERVKEALYGIPWYEMDIKCRKLLMFMTRKLQKRPVLRAKYMFPINLETYLSFVKTSYNVMALMNESR